MGEMRERVRMWTLCILEIQRVREVGGRRLPKFLTWSAGWKEVQRPRTLEMEDEYLLPSPSVGHSTEWPLVQIHTAVCPPPAGDLSLGHRSNKHVWSRHISP